MIRYSSNTRSIISDNFTKEYNVLTQWQQVHVDEQYFDRLAGFGIACLVAAIIGKLVMSSMNS